MFCVVLIFATVTTIRQGIKTELTRQSVRSAKVFSGDRKEEAGAKMTAGNEPPVLLRFSK